MKSTAGAQAPARSAALRAQIALAFLAIYLIWGSTFLATRFAVQTIPPFFVSGTRFFLAGVVLFAVGRIKNREPLGLRNWGAATLMGALFFLICHGGVSWAAQHVPSGISALLMASISMWTALLEWVRGAQSRPSRVVMISLLVGFGGIAVLLLHPEVLAGSKVGPLGAIVVLVGAFSWAAGTVLTRRMPLTTSTVVNSGMQMMTGGGLLLLLGVLSGQAAHFHPSATPMQGILAMVFLTFIGSLVGFTCYVWLLGVVPPTQVATYAYINPIVAVYLGFALAGEELTTRSLIASTIVIASVATIVTARGAPAAAEKAGFELRRGELSEAAES
jgi:drug/metabolite transporter (DMT)-like permease